jgi:two-component system chemotaxis response regulator CheB
MIPVNIEMIVVGGSAGALDALSVLLPALPGDFSVPIAIVLHLHPSKPSYLAQVLSAKSAVRVKEAEDKEPFSPATVYIAPPNYHLLVERHRCFALSVDDPVHFSRPAIDVLFESAADALGAAAAGVLLTGGNDDGARGLDRIARMGGITLVQSPESAPVRTMPEAALRRNPTHRALAPADIGTFLVQIGGNSRHPSERP